MGARGLLSRGRHPIPAARGPFRLLLDRAGTLSVGTYGRLWRVTTVEGRERIVEVALVPGGAGSRVQALAEDPSGAVWVGTVAKALREDVLR